MKVIFIALVFIVLVQAVSAAEYCDDNPVELTITAQALYEGVPYVHELSARNAQYYDFFVMGSEMPGFRINGSTISFTPGEADVGFHKVLLIAYNEYFCYDSKMAEFMVYGRPRITSRKPIESFLEVYEGNTRTFSAEITDPNQGSALEYRWILNGEIISLEQSLTYYFDFNSSGEHALELKATNSFNLSTETSWNISVINVNRPPYLNANISDQMWFENHNSSPFNLNSHFTDPDGDELIFTYMDLPATPAQTKIRIEISEDGRVTFFPRKDFVGGIRVRFRAEDPEGLYAESNIIMVQTIPYSVLCGDGICFEETCETCPEDCGECAVCVEKWVCSDWEDCVEGEIQRRQCVDNNLCGTRQNMPETSRPCPYSCSDRIQNQGEEGIDCGGPCPPCTTCNNMKLDGNETDVDCGGPDCNPCKDGNRCLRGLDCQSLVCVNNVCQRATCFDNTRNQGEEGVDCGGPCPNKCASCFDGIQNQGEEGIDCGGPCPPCPTCFDGIKNGDETFVDCGGSCRACGIMDYLKHDRGIVIKYGIIGLGAFLLLAVLLLGFNYVFKSTRTHASIGALTTLNSAARVFRKRTRFRNYAALAEAEKKFEALDKNPKNAEEALLELVGIITLMYSRLFELPREFRAERLNFEIKNSALPAILKSILMSFYAKVEELQRQDYVYAVQVEHLAKQARSIVEMLKKDLKA